jgi:Uma2 family endonuclease
MTKLRNLLEPILHSPQLTEISDLLNERLVEERSRRLQFYAEMTPEMKTEFIDGEVIMHSPARNIHLDATKWILKLMDTYVAVHGLGAVKSEKCLCSFPRNDYEPDIVFFGPAKAAGLLPGTMKFPVPDLVVEVLSESTQERDRGVKFEDYEAHSVQEYWIVDAEAGCVEQYVREGELLQLRMKSSTGELVSQAIPGFKAPVAACFGAEANLQALRHLIS